MRQHQRPSLIVLTIACCALAACAVSPTTPVTDIAPTPTTPVAPDTATPEAADITSTVTLNPTPVSSPSATTIPTATFTPTPAPTETATLTATVPATATTSPEPTLTPAPTPEPPATPTLEEKARALGDNITLKFGKKGNETVRQDLVEIAYKAPTARELWQALANDPGYLKDFWAAYREDFPDLDLEELVSTLYGDPTELFAGVLSIGPSDRCMGATCVIWDLTTKYDRSYGTRVVSGMKGADIEIAPRNFQANISDRADALLRQESFYKEAMSTAIMRELFNQGRVDKLDYIPAGQLADGLAIYLTTVYIGKNMPDNLPQDEIEYLKSRIAELRKHIWIKPEPIQGKPSKS